MAHDFLKKYIRRRLYLSPEVDVSPLLQNLTDNCSLVSPKLPPHVRFTQFALLANSLATDRRRRHVTNTPKHLVATCYFCLAGSDSYHILFHCPFILAIRKALFAELKLPLEHLEGGKLARLTFLLFCVPSPLNRRLVNLVVAFHSRVWVSREFARVRPDLLHTLSDDILLTTLQCISDTVAVPRPSTRLGKAGSRTAGQTFLARADHYAALALLPANTIHVYTDGGASPNPGPSGAGAFVLFPQLDACACGVTHPLRRVHLSAALGIGTNSHDVVAELVAN